LELKRTMYSRKANTPQIEMSWTSYKQSNSSSANPLSSTRDYIIETPGEKPEGSRVAPMTWATLEPSGFSNGVFRRELRELEGGFPELE
jgi:hypothetical protein